MFAVCRDVDLLQVVYGAYKFISACGRITNRWIRGELVKQTCVRPKADVSVNCQRVNVKITRVEVFAVVSVKRGSGAGYNEKLRSVLLGVQTVRHPVYGARVRVVTTSHWFYTDFRDEYLFSLRSRTLSLRRSRRKADHEWRPKSRFQTSTPCLSTSPSLDSPATLFTTPQCFAVTLMNASTIVENQCRSTAVKRRVEIPLNNTVRISSTSMFHGFSISLLCQ